MATTYVNLEDAAKQLGITVEQLTALRENGEAHGYRDGVSWKFKSEEIERLKAEDLEALFGEASDIHAAADVESGGDGSDSILLSEVELGEPDASESGPISTIIGADAGEQDVEGSDLDLTTESDLDLATDSSLELELDLDIESSDIHGREDQSDVALTEGTSNVLGGGSGVLDDTQLDENQAADLSAKFEKLDELDIDLEGEPSKVLSDPAQAMADAAAGDIGGESDLSLPDADLGSGVGSSAVQLDADEHDEVLLGDGSGSDITLSGEDSGISLLGPSDSGLSLEHTPPELGGSAVESLKVNQSDDSFTLDESTDSLADSTEDAPPPADSSEVEVKADSGDFMLTPMDEGAEEDADSGSQVIALESAEDMDESAVTRLSSGPIDLGEDLVETDDAAAAPVAVAAAAAPAAAPVFAREVQFSTWNTAFLGMCSFLMLLVGMMMIDLLRNMWSWNETYALNSSMMDWLLGALPF